MKFARSELNGRYYNLNRVLSIFVGRIDSGYSICLEFKEGEVALTKPKDTREEALILLSELMQDTLIW